MDEVASRISNYLVGVQFAKYTESVYDGHGECVNLTTSKSELAAWELDDYDPVREAEYLAVIEKAPTMSTFWSDKYKRDASRNWHQFYNRHKSNFFKDRHFLEDAFEELKDAGSDMSEDDVVLLEIGCGVGNAFYPLLERKPKLRVFASDFARSAVELAKLNPLYDPKRVTLWVHDAAVDPLPTFVTPVDYVLIYFVMSALDPKTFATFIRHATQTLKPGGTVFLRDYGRGDLAQVRFAMDSEPKKLQENLFVRQDGTLAYYFTTEELACLFQEQGLEAVANDYVRRIYRNRKLGTTMHRIWVQSRFRKL